ncbi:S-DNA-T family DNA segregation ATPase FtsK/SpoIIIE [Salirhabdus euzebyi]|uniref:S-DNA-T family DNA segregation ATPase FtsK/SpoIIIE n=1 Tax=Salirhabdus euzebyi TaxID=394506 RepID=A0A841PT38_9BACI|nr:DNA translocase FtsK [Salirhabdus euzebyi]MBB6452147.1 S-DNA-T family DNA segregation ATPase FtsK/SpoIIIE [Salirhabdus euzebyi]
MFNRFRKWIKEMFNEEKNEKTTYVNRASSRLNNGSQHLQTRMSFQYPQQHSTQQPVIAKRQETRVMRNRNQGRKSKVEERESTSSKKEPFRATNVPSPVYGYSTNRSLHNSEISEVPAYIRKKQQPQSDVSFEQSLDDQHLTEIVEIAEKEIHSKIIPFDLQKRKVTDKTREESRKETIPTEDIVDSIIDQPYKEEEEEENSFLLSDDSQNTETFNEEIKNEAVQKRNSKSLSPFNVIMTPRDKKAYHHKSTTGTNNTLPPLHLLDDLPKKETNDEQWLKEQTERLETTLNHFNVRAKVSKTVKGPTVTRFEVQPDIGVKVSKITSLSDDIKMNLAAKDIRMEAPIPGKNAIGIEVPNLSSSMVTMHDILQSSSFKQQPSKLAVGLGLDIEGKAVVTDLKKMPHGLIAGATGSGKSVCINTILVSLLYKASYEDVKFLLIDPKMVELAPYNHIPHLVAPVITDVKAATSALKWAVDEMENRYTTFAEEGVRDIERYNQKAKEKMPYIVIIIDELADLMMASPQDVEDAICRIAQKARACGIHLLLATQRPSVDVITGLIKANVPTRIAFSVSSQVDSRTIIDSNGAEKLLGKGDMLFVENGVGKPKRIQGAFVSDDEIERVTSYVKKLAPPNYLFEQEDLIQSVSLEENEDDLLQEAIEIILGEGKASTSFLQRKFSIGYNRAARLIDRMEEIGLISEQNGSKPRDILLSKEEVKENIDFSV